MGPSKRKGSVRRQVLDLNTREDSPTRPTWQTKYQNVLPGEEVHQNGSLQPSKGNPLSGLLGNYNSDSDSEEPPHKPNRSLDAKVEDFLKEIQSISAETISKPGSEVISQQAKHQVETSYPSTVTSWQQCYDPNSGYPYYWNMLTNEVTWEMPADLKAAIANVAIVQQQQQLQEQSAQQPPVQAPAPKPVLKKKVCKYPWQAESDSEDEKIELITSFGPQSEDESEGEQSKEKSNTRKKPQPKLSYPSKVKSNRISLAPEDPEGLNESTYETSSLLTHSVQDTGPPGDDSFQGQKNKAKEEKLSKEKETISVAAHGKSQLLKETVQKPGVLDVNLQESNEKIEVESDNKNSINNIADDVIAQIEKEMPPDYRSSEKSVSSPKPEISDSDAKPSLALIANYGDDSESEDNNSFSEKNVNSSKSLIISRKPLFPIQIPEEHPKPIFPCVSSELTKPTEVPRREQNPDESEPISNIYNSEADVSDPAAFKAFKRKKRIEFATTIMPQINKSKSSSPDKIVSAPTTQYNLDPNANEHQGFGFNALKAKEDSEKKTYKNCGGIQFVKAETIHLTAKDEKPIKSEIENDNTSAPKVNLKESMKEEEIEDAATLLREKVNFLTGGMSKISPIQQLAIELETLYNAWRLCALAPPYLIRWLNEKCGELLRHEKAAAPPGWTCLWDRKSKRYYYRNSTTKAIEWEYPNVEGTVEGEDKGKMKEGEVEGCGDEMDICDTPPHVSPSERDKQSDEPPSPPPPPVISDVSENTLPPSPTPLPPPPPQISFSSETDPSFFKVSKKKKRNPDEQCSSEGDADSCPTPSSETFDQDSENSELAPPLPPMPPPPPPPPDESPPPLPDSPLPLPLDPNQPLPPGVDEPEYSLYTAVKHSYKKTTPDSAAYSAELMLTYGYGLPVQQVVSSSGQPMTVPIQPIEYHTYVHESVSSPYLVQSAATSHVIHCPAKKPKPSLTSELVSFYSDIAMLDNSSHDNNNQVQSSAVPPPQEPAPTTTQAVIASTVTTNASTCSTTSVSSVKSSESSVTANGINIKKKKKTKASSALSLKKKGVSSLVAKWQQVQQEVRKDFSDDDEDTK